MDFYKVFYDEIYNITKKLCQDHNITLNKEIKFTVESPRDENHGDLSTNIAMVLCKNFSQNPMALADIYKSKIQDLEGVGSVSVVKPGFINIVFHNSYWYKFLKHILIEKENFGRVNIGKGERVNIEYVSANPTGPLHVGHGRGAVIGDVLASIYEFFGFDVTKEYYINDAGNQIDAIANSLFYRYCEIINPDFQIEKHKDFYPGEYLIEAAETLLKQDGEIWINEDKTARHEYFKQYAIKYMIDSIKKDLKSLGIQHDIFVSEKEVSTNENYNQVLEYLNEKNLIYVGTLPPPKGHVVEEFEEREQKLVKTTLYGDDMDRPLEKQNGERTYFANDMVYHYDKIKRGFTKIINIWGADHIGYIKRMSAIVSALSNQQISLQIICSQLVNLSKDNKPIRMSKRQGNFITLNDLISVIGKDIFRFMMITSKYDATLELDVDIVNKQNLDNPVFYIQYAYARIHSVLSKAKINYNFNNYDLSEINFDLLQTKQEIKLIKSLIKLPKYMESAWQNNDPHRIYLYLMEVSSNFHSLWQSGKINAELKFINDNNEKLTIARLYLIKCVAICLKNMLCVLGISIKEKM